MSYLIVFLLLLSPFQVHGHRAHIAAYQAEVCGVASTPDAACDLETGVEQHISITSEATHWYRLPATTEPLTLTIRADAPLEIESVLHDASGYIVAQVATPATAVAVSPPAGERWLVEVHWRSGSDDTGTYTILASSTLPEQPAVAPSSASLPQPDALENNWDAEHASPIALDTVYDLTFVCPETRGDACPGGDHDYLRFPAKAGIAYLIATFDLGPGVDTVLDLYMDDLEHPLLANDDARPGGGLLSVLRWVAPHDGEAVIRIGPRMGAVQPALPGQPEGAAHYRVAVALARGALAADLAGRIADQTNLPDPPATTNTADHTTAPVVGGGAAAPAAPPPTAASTQPISDTAEPVTARVVQGDSVKGNATALITTTVRLRPEPDGEPITVLSPESVVTLLGKHSNLWVRVQPPDTVLDGWVLATDLRRVDPDAQEPPSQPVNPAGEPVAPVNPAGEPVAPPKSAEPPVSTTLLTRVLPKVPAPEPNPPPVSHTVSVTVTVRLAGVTSGKPSRRATPVPGDARAGMRVQLVNAFGDVLAEALTPSSGEVVLQRSVLPDTGLWIRLPAPGLLLAVTGPRLEIVLPEDVWRP